MTNIFGTETPALPDANDSVALVLATRFTPDVDGQITHARWRFPNTLPGGTVQATLYRVGDGAQLGTVNFPGSPVAGAWNEVAFASPVDVVDGTEYAIAILTPDRYVATSAYSWPKVSGELSASGAQLSVNPVMVMPTNPSFGDATYFADVVFSTGDPELVPVSRDVVLPFAVLDEVHRDVTLPFVVLPAVARDVALPFAVLAAVSRDVVLRWTVEAEEDGSAFGLLRLYRDILTALRQQLAGGPGKLRVADSPADTVSARSVVVGPPRFSWEGMCDPDAPTSCEFTVSLIEQLDEKAIDRLLARLPELITAVQSINDATVTDAQPAAFPAGTSDLPSYLLTVSMDL